MSNMGFLVVTYQLLWGGIFAYLIFLNNQQRRLCVRLKGLEEALAEREAKP